MKTSQHIKYCPKDVDRSLMSIVGIRKRFCGGGI